MNENNIPQDIIEFITFTTELQEELETSYYCTNINPSSFSSFSYSSTSSPSSSSSNNLLLLLTCERFETPRISICGEINLNSEETIIGMWELQLTREIIKEHVKLEERIIDWI